MAGFGLPVCSLVDERHAGEQNFGLLLRAIKTSDEYQSTASREIMQEEGYITYSDHVADNWGGGAAQWDNKSHGGVVSPLGCALGRRSTFSWHQLFGP
jgi:hypothetical protein